MDFCIKEEVLETMIVTERRPRNSVVLVPPLGSIIELSDSNTDEDEGHDLDSVVANTMNGASSSVESQS